MNSRNCNTCWIVTKLEIYLSDRKKITLNRSNFPSFTKLKTPNTQDQAGTQEKQKKIRKNRIMSKEKEVKHYSFKKIVYIQNAEMLVLITL